MRGELRGGTREAADDRGASRAQGRARLQIGRHAEERTENIAYILVTLEVSKLSGWLSADACCQESNGGHTVCGVSCGEGGGRRRATEAHAACRGGLDYR